MGQDMSGDITNTEVSDGDKDFGAIVVVANGAGNYTVSSGDIREMVDAFRKWAPKYAPDARLYLDFKPAKNQPLAKIEAELSRGKDIIALSIGADGMARLPVENMGDGKWDLAVNQVKGKLRIFPTVLSPGTSPSDRRVGDLRLQCRVFWGFYNNQVNILLRGMFDTIGGCTSRRVGFYYTADRPLESAIVDGKDDPQQLLMPRKTAYLVPLADKDIADEARLHLTYAEPGSGGAGTPQP